MKAVLSQGEPPDAAVNFASGAKASTKRLESLLKVIQGHAFWDH